MAMGFKTNRKINQIQYIVSSSSIASNADTYNTLKVTALGENTTINAPSGTAIDGQMLLIEIKDNGTSRTLTWNAIFINAGADLPITTIVNTLCSMLFVYDSVLTKWKLRSIGYDTSGGSYTGKKIPRVYSTTSSATVTPNIDLYDVIDITAQAEALTIANPTGTPFNKMVFMIDIYSAAAQTIAFGNLFAAGGVDLPTTTVLGKQMSMVFVYTNSLYKLRSLAQEG